MRGKFSHVEIFANFANACHWRNFSPSEQFATSGKTTHMIYEI